MSPKALPLYRWLYRWFGQSGQVWASTRYLAQKQGVSERTIYRWLAQFESIGAIQREVEDGIERRVIPLALPPEKAAKTRRSMRVRGKLGGNGINKNVRGSVRGSDKFCQGSTIDVFVTGETTTIAQCLPDTGTPDNQVSAELTGELISQGVAEPVAKSLVRDDAAEVRKQLKAIRYRTAVNKAAALVASIKGRWSMPSQVGQDAKKANESTEMAQKRAERAAKDAERAERQEAGRRAYEGLTEQEKARYSQLAYEQLQAESPGAFQVLSKSASFESILRSRAIQIAGLGG